MKLNATPRHYMPLSQNQSDDDESGPSKEDKGGKLSFKSSFDAIEGLPKGIRQTETDEVDKKKLPMSPIRIFMFTLSLIMCFLFVVIFVFFVPCTMSDNLDGTCHITYKWKKLLHNMSFTPPLDFVASTISKDHLIILGYMNGDYGLIALQVSNGKERWRLPLHSMPESAICNLIDINSDGTPECLVVGSNGLLVAVDVKKGISLWYLHNHSDLNKANSVYGPIIIPDCDEDGILDLVISYNISSDKNTFYLALVSGGSGQVIGSLLELSQCTEPVTARFSWKSQNETHIVLHCVGEKNSNLWLVSVRDICDAALNETGKLSLKSVFRVPHSVRQIQFYKLSSSENQLVVALDGVKFILLERSPRFMFHIVWKTYLEGQKLMRIVTDGQFIEGSNQLVVTDENVSHSKVIGLSLVDGREIWSIIQDTGTVTYVSKLTKFFGNTDALIFKILTPATVYETQINDKNLGTNSSNIYKEDAKKTVLKNDVRSLKEKYILVRCGKISAVKTISTEEILTFCKGSICEPNIYTTNMTVLVSGDELNAAFEMLTVTTTVVPANNTLAIVEAIIISYFSLKNNLMLSTCAR